MTVVKLRHNQTHPIIPQLLIERLQRLTVQTLREYAARAQPNPEINTFPGARTRKRIYFRVRLRASSVLAKRPFC
ncbi:hypothetical protein NDU88_003522 [Pleurodeles waltl]|uniref:Uncharacterized protein n=1 Tax=Pleurodeles waltl TaxID=8319 RepID=A0AAV7NGW8_PLEWA|nr:hypothetical protein NDU88_003522 [Pleurodeles waltl]